LGLRKETWVGTVNPVLKNARRLAVHSHQVINLLDPELDCSVWHPVADRPPTIVRFLRQDHMFYCRKRIRLAACRGLGNLRLCPRPGSCGVKFALLSASCSSRCGRRHNGLPGSWDFSRGWGRPGLYLSVGYPFTIHQLFFGGGWSQAVWEALKDTSSRITTIAQVNDHLWRSARIGYVDIADFAGELCRKLQETVPHTVRCTFAHLRRDRYRVATRAGSSASAEY
jgi:hypothetical protein